MTTETCEIKNRFTGAVQFVAEIECDADASWRSKLGLAVRVAVKARADLRGADLRGAYLGDAYLGGADLHGAYLGDANLGGLILLPARATRSDGYEYFAWTSVLGGMVITAGCREWIGEDAIQQARKHCETETAERCRAEALRIVNHIEAAWNEHRAEIGVEACSVLTQSVPDAKVWSAMIQAAKDTGHE